MTWRQRRVIRYENAAIPESTDDDESYAASELRSYRELTESFAERVKRAEAAGTQHGLERNPTHLFHGDQSRQLIDPKVLTAGCSLAILRLSPAKVWH